MSYSFFNYSYIDVKDLDNLNETFTKINVWQLSDSERMEFLLNNLKAEHYENTIFAIVLDLTRPWEFMDQLSKWSDVIFEINKKLFLQLPVVKQNELRKKMEDHFKLYKNPDKRDEEYAESNEEGKENSNQADEMHEAIKEMALDEGVLNVNLGIPILII